MDREQQARAEEIALVAVGLDPAEREAYLRRRPAGDPEILAEVRRRLELAARIPDGFLDRPAVELVGGAEDPAADRPSGDGSEEAAAPAEPRRLPFAEGRRYLLAETLGTGGMAVVFRAFDQRLERQVAIKHLRYALAEDPRALQRFEREARAIAKVSHPAVVQVFDVLHDGDDLWIVMELVPGRPLASRLEEGPLELGEALGLAADIAGGLAAAHARGIVHRDLKAANVMVTPEGRASAGRGSPARASAGRGSPARASAGHAKILDFGLARSVSSDDDSLSADSGLRGTPAAMSPEQVSRSPVDSRSDLFSFGALLYRMVTGVSPFAGPSPLVTLERVCRLRPTPARRFNPRLPEELSSLIERLLEKDPGRRPRDTAAVARTLARLAESATAAAAASTRHRAPLLDAAGAAFPSAAAERREVTILSCRLVAGSGSGRLLDPEELLEIEGPFWELAVSILDHRRAHLAERLDGGFRAYFGYPRAREDDPHRAVSAALELAAALERRSAGTGRDPTAGFSLRAGLHTGPIVVTTSPSGRQQVVRGRTGFCADEMGMPTGSGGVLVSTGTHRLVQSRFRFRSLGACSLARCRQPCEIYRVLATRPAGDEDEGAEELTPFLGREAELGLLGQRWRQAGEGRGRVVLVSGEAGSGKSRLVRVFRRLPAVEPGTWLAVSCRPASSPEPLIRRLSRALGSEVEEEPGVLATRLAERAAGGAAVLAIEDVHLADPSDLELLGLLIDRVPAARLLILLTCRPPFEAPWKLPLHLTVCSLGPLASGPVKRMIRHFAAGRALSAAAQQRILVAADGVPRFVEELTRTLLSSEVLTAEGAPSLADGGELAGPRPPAVIPATLRSWLTARLDRLCSAREVARAASVLGREFTREQLSALVPTAGDAIERGLDRLVEAEILQQPGGRRTTYRFRLALDREAACESLIGEHRRLYQRRAGLALAGAQESSSRSSRAATRSGRSAPSLKPP